MSANVKLVSKEKAKKKYRVLFWSAECKYSVIIDRVNEYNWKQIDDDKQQGKVNIFWIDCATIHEHFRTIQPWQCINHFPGMPNVARKNKMGQNLNKMLKLFPKEYSFYPRTWILPSELSDFRNQFDSNGNSIGNKIYIIKPDSGCQGRGIYLTKTWEKVPLNENVVAQMYIKKPLLVDGYKFDLRIYVLVASVKPLRVYLFHDGLVRMCTEEYVKPTSKNLDQSCMHLTNYAVNKHNDNFSQPTDDDGDSGHKRSLQWFMDWIRAERGDAKAEWVWNRMGVIIMRTLLSIMPILSREYDQHFKSFNNVPVDMKSILTSSNGYAAVQPTGASNSGDAPSRAGRLQQAKAFSLSNIDMGNITGSQKATNNSTSSNSNNNNNNNNGNNSNNSASNSNSNSNNNSAKERSNENETEEDSASQNGGSDPGVKDSQNNESEGEGDDGNSNSSTKGQPKVRGSRCFEVLGYDIMLDSNLNPWIIEVNHLPSFGTDSPMDLDIKQRLMEQVFSVLPVRADDQQAYAAHHKAESEKRLVSQNRINALTKREKEAKEREAKEKERAKPPLRPREVKRDLAGKVAADANMNMKTADMVKSAEEATRSSVPANGMDSPGNPIAEDDESELFDEEVTPERLAEIKTILFDIYSKYSTEKLNKIDRLLAKYVTHEEEFLRFVLGKYNVDPALYKSQVKGQRSGASSPAGLVDCAGGTGGTDGIGGSAEVQEGETPPPGTADSNERPSTASGIAHSPNGNEEDGGDQDTADEHTADEAVSGAAPVNSRTECGDSPHGDTTENGSLTARSVGKAEASGNEGSRNQIRDGSKRVSRSMSPPRSAMLPVSSNRRASAAWKTSTEEEDAKFRAEVLAMHVPKDDDEWLLFETSRLTEFTRLFPPMPPSKKAELSGAPIDSATAAELAVEVQGEEENEEEEDEGANTEITHSNNNKNSNKDKDKKEREKEKEKEIDEKLSSASYEEIIFQAFLHDRRQTMRMHQPLHSRKVITDDNVSSPSSFLPPLDSARSSFSSLNSNGKGAVGWKAPPKPVRDTIVRQPTQGQADAAKRLSQGLSVASASGHHSSRQRYAAQNHVHLPNALASTGYSVVLDPHEYHLLQGAGASASNPAPQQQQQQYTVGAGAGAGPYVPMYGGVHPSISVESKPEPMWPSTKANRLLEESRLNRMRLEAAKANSAASVRDQVPAAGASTEGLTLIPPTGNTGNSASTGGLFGAENIDSNGSVADDGTQSQQMHHRVQGNATTGGGAGGAVQVTGSMQQLQHGGSMKFRTTPAPALQHVRHASTGNMNANLQAATQAHQNGTSNHSQEELLRQLFPSWF